MGRLPRSYRYPPERDRKGRLPGVEGFNVLYELLPRHMPAVVVRQEIKRFPLARLTLKHDAEVRVAEVAEDHAGH
jgi:hypothetical protein